MSPILPLLAAFVLLPAGSGATTAVQSVAEGETAGYYFIIARHLEENGKPDLAIDALNRAIALAPDSAEVRAELAALYARLNRVADAAAAAEGALERDPGNRAANRLLGSILAALFDQKQPLRLGDDPKQYAARALTLLERVREPPDPALDATIGRLYLAAGEHEKAIAALQRVFAEKPEYSEGGLMLARAQEAAGKKDEAIATLDSTIKHNPLFFRAYVRLIALYEEQRRWKEAAATYALAQEINPMADLAAGRATALINGGALKEAEDYLKRSIGRRDAPDAALLYLLAESQRQLKEYDAAAATAQTLRTAFPNDLRGLLMGAQLHVVQGRTNEAIAAFADLVKRVPEEPSFVYQYAQLLEQAGRVPEAERALRELIARDPEDANALNSLGYMFADRGERLEEAVSLLQRALKLEPGNPSFLDSLGWAFFRQGRLTQADQPLAEAAAKLPENSVIQDHLGDLRFRQQRYGEAVAAWERALAGDGESIDRPAIEKKLIDARRRARN
jgi:tetratricopeptide (TPR) repeat protein